MTVDELPHGPGYVCFDASPLIDYGDQNALGWLGTWFSPGPAFTADVITKVELAKSLPRYPQNAQIIGLPWLKSIPVEEDVDVQLVVSLRRLWGSDSGRDHGEAEVVALCKRYGWTAIVDDARGRDGAERHGVAHVSSTGMLVAATAFHRESVADAWALHQRLVSGLDRPLLPSDDLYEPAFRAAVSAAGKLAAEQGEQWPQLLAESRLDKLVLRAVAKVRGQ